MANVFDVAKFILKTILYEYMETTEKMVCC